MINRLIIFALLNFGALAIGGIFTGSGVPSDWYQSLNKAPWTPPGWVFGAAWTTIMVLFTIFLSIIWDRIENKQLLIVLFTFQWVLNVGWNPVFFYFHLPLPALFVIVGLLFLVVIITFRFHQSLALSSLMLPYILWLIIATSLNAYVVLYN